MLTFQEVSYCSEKSPQNFGGFFFMVIIFLHYPLFISFIQEIKRKVLDQTDIYYVTIGGLADEWISYMLSKEEYEKGGYEASVSFYGPTLGPLVVDRIVDAATSFQLQLLAKN